MNTFKEAVHSLWSSKQRTLLALLGITIGIASVIALISVGSLVEREAMKQFEALGTDFLLINFYPENSDAGRFPVVTDSHVNGMENEVEMISMAAPIVEAFGEPIYRGKKIDTQMYGVNSSLAQVHRLTVEEGRFISDADGNSQYCVIGANVADELRQYGPEQLIGEQIRIDKRIYTIIGTLARMPEGGIMGFDANTAFLIPMQAAGRISGNKSIAVVHARNNKPGQTDLLREEIDNYYKSQLDNIRTEVETAEAIIKQMEKQSKMFTLMLAAIGSIFLLVGGVGVMNVMLVSVSERKVEIGIRRAIGARQSEVQSQFLVEAIVLCLLGGLLGVIFGVLSSYFVARASDWEFFISGNAILIGVIVSSVVGLFFGFYPARQAARLDVIDCIRGS